MKPFRAYPGWGEQLLPPRSGGNARHGYGLELQSLSDQRCCAYCGVDLVSDYYRWLLIAVDHVVPMNECKRLGIPDTWADSYSSMVLSCSGCNGFDNRYRVPENERQPQWSEDHFFTLIEKTFEIRKKRIRKRRDEEMAFHCGRPWEHARNPRYPTQHRAGS